MDARLQEFVRGLGVVPAKRRVGPSFKGILPDLASSGLQKAIRRGQTWHACRIAMDIWLFSVHDTGTSQAQITNMVNRLHIISVEDIGVGSPFLPVILEKQFALLAPDLKRKLKNTRRFTAGGLCALLEIVTTMCNAPHSRMVGLLNTAFYAKDRADVMVQEYPELGSDSRMQGAPPTFQGALRAGSYMAIKYAGAMAPSDVWASLSSCMSQNPRVLRLIRVLKERYATHKSEVHLFLIEAILVAIYTFRGSWPVGVDLHPSVDTISPARALRTLKRHVREAFQGIPAEAIDMHTGAGNRRGFTKKSVKGIEQFLQHGTRLYKEIGLDKRDLLNKVYAHWKYKAISAPFPGFTPHPEYQAEDQLPEDWRSRRAMPAISSTSTEPDGGPSDAGQSHPPPAVPTHNTMPMSRDRAMLEKMQVMAGVPGAIKRVSKPQDLLDFARTFQAQRAVLPMSRSRVIEDVPFLHTNPKRRTLQVHSSSSESADEEASPIRRSQLTSVRLTKDRTCGGKPPSFYASYRGQSVFMKPASATGKSLQWQLLADLLKPMFGLRPMGIAIEKVLAKVQRGEDGKPTLVKSDTPQDFVVCPKAEGAQLSKSPEWESSQDLVRQYILIGHFRYGTLRFSDFNTANVMLLQDGRTLLSIDECGVGRTRVFSNLIKRVSEYLANPAHRESIRNVIAGWKRTVHSNKTGIEAIVERCGLPRSDADAIQHNIQTLQLQLP